MRGCDAACLEGGGLPFHNQSRGTLSLGHFPLPLLTLRVVSAPCSRQGPPPLLQTRRSCCWGRYGQSRPSPVPPPSWGLAAEIIHASLCRGSWRCVRSSYCCFFASHFGGEKREETGPIMDPKRHLCPPRRDLKCHATFSPSPALPPPCSADPDLQLKFNLSSKSFPF